jgi:hypothetical protein
MWAPPWHARVTHQLRVPDQPTCHQRHAITSLAYVEARATWAYILHSYIMDPT